MRDLPKDILLFLYDDSKPYTDKLFQLINYVIAFLEPNKNIQVFVCNPLRNDLALEVPVDPLPAIVFFKNNIKDDPIFYSKKEINPESVLKFAKEKTTFDWVEEQYGSGADDDQTQQGTQGSSVTGESRDNEL